MPIKYCRLNFVFWCIANLKISDNYSLLSSNVVNPVKKLGFRIKKLKKYRKKLANINHCWEALVVLRTDFRVVEKNFHLNLENRSKLPMNALFYNKKIKDKNNVIYKLPIMSTRDV